jgi:NAD(P)-dependent dehydrogenase (short-subunit alcohol dehydrogenase family)
MPDPPRPLRAPARRLRSRLRDRLRPWLPGSCPQRPANDQRVLLTGAAGGLGRALAFTFGARGCRIGALDLPGAPLDTLISDLRAAGIETLPLAADITHPAAVAAAVDTLRDAWGGLDLLINNAGISHLGPLAETEPAVIRRVLEVDLFGAIHCTQSALPLLLAGRGQIIAISSVAGFAPLWGRTAYAAAKHGMLGFFNTLRSEVRPAGVAILVVCPSFIATGIGRAALDARGGPLQRNRHTTGRIATPEEIAAAILHAAESEQELLLPSLLAQTARILTCVAPRLYERLMLRSIHR